MKVEQFFFEHPVFRHEEFAQFKSYDSDISPISINTALTYYANSGQIKPIRRKLYAVIPPNQTPDRVLVDPYLVAGKATDDAIIGYHSALELLGVAYSSFGQLTYITQQKSKPFDFNGHWYQSVLAPKALQKKQEANSYIDIVNRQGVNIRVTNAARTYVDALDRIELCGGWEEVVRSLSSLAVLNIDQVIDYCLMLNNARLNAKVGYFLSQRQGAFAVTKEQLAPLLTGRPKVAQYITGASGESFQFVEDWNIYLPLSVINQSWEEPDVEF